MENKYPNSGAIFTNNRQRAGRKDPDRNGSTFITCPACNRESEFWIAGWIKEGNGKGKFLSVSFTPKEERGGNPASKPANTPAPAAPPEEDDAPF